MKCKRCSSSLSGKQKAYCSDRCSRLYLKSLYRKRNKEKVQTWKDKYFGEHGKKITPTTRERCLTTYNNQCFRCSATVNLEVHHWKPYKHGGTNELKNLVVFCKECHIEIHEEFKTKYWQLSKKTVKGVD